MVKTPSNYKELLKAQDLILDTHLELIRENKRLKKNIHQIDGLVTILISIFALVILLIKLGVL